MSSEKIGIWHCELDRVPEGKHLSCGARYFDENNTEQVVALVEPYTEDAPDNFIWERARSMIEQFEMFAKREGITLIPLDEGSV